MQTHNCSIRLRISMDFSAYICNRDRNVILFLPISEIYWHTYKANAVMWHLLAGVTSYQAIYEVKTLPEHTVGIMLDFCRSSHISTVCHRGTSLVCVCVCVNVQIIHFHITDQRTLQGYISHNPVALWLGIYHDIHQYLSGYIPDHNNYKAEIQP